MTNYWAIAIGINQYQFLQPLMYAQWDAYCLQQCLQTTAQFPPGQCRVLTDTSAPVGGQSTVPTRSSIQHHIVDVCQKQVGAEDVLWVFFSGYGACDGGRDYLMPLDGDPRQPISAGIPMSELMATLKTAPTSNILLLLDMKQFGGGSGNGTENLLGQHTLALAQEHQIATVLSCQPGQFAHETLALRQGIFTAALLEAIQQVGCITLEHLTQYLGDRLPELSEQHWRPRQDPAIFIPTELRYQLILPGKGIPGEGAPAKDPRAVPGGTPGWDSPPSEQPRSPVQDTVPPTASPPPSPESPPASNLPIPQPSPSPAPSSSEDDREGDQQFWRDLLKWGGALLALLLLGVLIRNWSAFRGNPDANPSNGNAAERLQSAPSGALPTAQTNLQNSGSSAPSDTANPSPLDFDPEFSEGSIDSPLEAAQQAIVAGSPLEALDILDQVPANEQTERYANLRAEAERLNNQVIQTNQAILNEALASMNRAREETPVNQASDFHRAMEQASRIQPGQPLYDEAQQAIQRWSYVIFALPKARANTGDFADAIASARLIPSSQEDAYAKAQAFIQQWQQNITQTSASQEVIEQASTLIQPGQASSYNDAIAQLRSIQPNQPGHEEVRAQINQWSKDIMEIAYARSSEGNVYEAINAAALVPNDAEVFLEAREAIEGWRTELRGN
jgi:hypothetical protein